MAVIEISHPHLNELLGKKVDVETLEEKGSMLGILFEDSEDDKIEVEVEPNRPDLLSVEGVARALRGFFEFEEGMVSYAVDDGDVEVEVDSSVEEVRPHIACARVKDLDLGEDELNSIIQLQEKLTETYGRKRKKIAIGLHDMEPLEPPISYRAVEPGSESFVPLGMEEEMDLEEILEEHDKGRKYGWILEDEEKYPLLEDSDGNVLSFPPVINGELTEVDTGSEDVFIDVTGTSEREVETALNIIVAAFHERGGTIEAVHVEGERLPDMSGELMELDAEYARNVSGLEDLSDEGIAEQLEKMRYDATADSGKVEVTVPAYRADVMHPYDVIEDAVIGYGYGNVQAEIPQVSTIGSESRETVFIDKLREYMAGSGAQECMTFVLSNREKLFGKMGLEEQDIAEMENALTEEYSVVRNWMLPSLVEVLKENQHNRYPQKLFEAGKCSRLSSDSETGAEDFYRLSFLSAHTDTGFSEVRGVLQSLASSLGLELEVEEGSHGSFRDKRFGKVYLGGEEAGFIGEIREEVLENWGLEVPVSGFEVEVGTLQELVQD